MEAEDAHVVQGNCFRYRAKPHDIPATQVEQQLRQDKEDAEEAEDARVAQAEIDAATPRRRPPQVHLCPNKAFSDSHSISQISFQCSVAPAKQKRGSSHAECQGRAGMLGV